MNSVLENMLSVLGRALAKINTSIGAFPTGSQVLGLGRTILSGSQLLFLLLTPSAALFTTTSGPNPAMGRCEDGTLNSLSLFCATDNELARWLLILLLVVITSGLLPRIFSWVHVYVSLSIVLATNLPDNGDFAITTAALWIAIASLADNRLWHWQKPPAPNSESKTTPWLQPIAWAGHWLLILQMVYIYLVSSLVKFSVGPWQEGDALYYLMRSNFVGPAGFIGDVFRWATSMPLIAAAMTWGTIIAEIIIAVFLLRSAKYQRISMVIALLLHVGIFIAMGLFYVSAVMIGGMLCATALAWEKVRDDQPAATSTVADQPADKASLEKPEKEKVPALA